MYVSDDDCLEIEKRLLFMCSFLFLKLLGLSGSSL